MWDPSRPGLEPVFPALAGRFLTTVPPGKSPRFILYFLCLSPGTGHFCKGLGSGQWWIVFGNQNLGARCAYYYICFAAPRPSHWTMLENTYPYKFTSKYFILYLSIYTQWAHTNSCNSEHRVHPSLIPLCIFHFLLCHWETWLPLSSIYLFVQTSVYIAILLTLHGHLPCGLASSCHLATITPLLSMSGPLLWPY